MYRGTRSISRGARPTHTVCMEQAMSVNYQRGSVQPEVLAQPWCRLHVCGWNLPQRQACDAYLADGAAVGGDDNTMAVIRMMMV